MVHIPAAAAVGVWMVRRGRWGGFADSATVAGMAIAWTVQVLAGGQENRQAVDSGEAGTDGAARTAAAAALVVGAQRWGRHEFWVTVGGAAVIVIPGLDHAGKVDAGRLCDALDLLSATGLR